MAERIIKVKVNVENNIVIDKTEEKKLCKILVSKGDKGQDGTVSFDELTEEQKAYLKGEDGVGIPKGGKAGQILSKISDDDYKTKWIDNNTEVDLTEYAKKTYVDEKIANIEVTGGDIDLSNYALKEELPTKTSELENDSGFVNENELNEKGYLTEHQDLSNYAKKTYVDEKIANIPSYKKFDFPIGFIYMSVEETSPAEIFGGIWEQIKDTFLLACGDTYDNGDVGGEAEHTLTIDEMPKHTHTVKGSLYYGAMAEGVAFGNDNTPDYVGNVGMSYVGGSNAHNNMPPYLSVYVWKKIGEDSITNSYAVASAWENYNNGGADGTLIYNNLKLWMGNYDGTPNILDGVSLDFEIEGSFNLMGTFNFYAYEGAPRNFGIYIFKDGNLYKELPQQFDTLGSAFDVSINELVETGTYEIVIGAYNNYEFGINSGTISFVEN